jgi:hypothetical protein
VSPVGPAARKLRPDLTNNITRHAKFPFDVWHGQFAIKIQTGVVGHAKIARKYRFLAIGEICGSMKASDVHVKMPFLTMR